MKIAVSIFTLFLFYSCNSIDQKSQLGTELTGLTGKSGQSGVFNQSFKNLLSTYYQLKDQFITEDITAINSGSKLLLQAIDSLHIYEFNGATTMKSTAQSYIDGISSEINGLLGETDLESKRKSLQMISEQLYDLVRTVQYDQEVVYHEYCPMAFNNEGATWLSNTSIISNPYLPKKMLTCGEVRDSIDFRRKQ